MFNKKHGVKVDMPSATPPTPLPEPRPMEELNKIYEELCKRTGALQYRMAVDKADLERLNEAILNVNNEAAARQQRDTKAKEESNQ